MIGAGFSSPARSKPVLFLEHVYLIERLYSPTTVCVVHAPSCGFRGSVAGNYPPSAARASPTASSLGGEAVADGNSLVLVASLLGFTHGGVAGLGLTAGADPSLLLSSLSRLNMGWRWQLWTVAKLRASASRSKSTSGFLSATRFLFFFLISFKSKALFHQVAFLNSSRSSSSCFLLGVMMVYVEVSHLQSVISATSVASHVALRRSRTNFWGSAAMVVR